LLQSICAYDQGRTTRVTCDEYEVLRYPSDGMLRHLRFSRRRDLGSQLTAPPIKSSYLGGKLKVVT